MNLEIISFNGTSLNDSSFKAYFPKPSVMAGPEGDAGFVERSYFGPVFTRKRRKPRTLPVHIKMLGTVASNVDTLKALFNPYANDEYKLLVKDLNDSDKQYYVYGTPISIPDVDGQEMVVNLWVADPVWKTETETSVNWAVTGTGDQESITVGGSFYSEPTFEITPTAAKSGGKAYRIFCPVYNPSTTIEYTDYPLDIVNNGLDTAALVADTTRTVTINDGDGITDADATITYDGEVGTFPTSGLAYLETEQITYTGKSATELTGCTRGVNGTSAAAHANDVVIYASKMEADGGDIRVTVDGIQDNFWLQDISNATSQVWINVDLSPGYAMTNGVLIASSGAITTITLENSTANIDAINALPINGRLMIDSELFSYTGKNVTTRQFTGVTREAFSTTAAEHTVGDNVRWIEHEIYVYHGVHDLPAFAVDDAYKPCIELDSTNLEWTWDANFAFVGTSARYTLTHTAMWRVRFPENWSSTDLYDRTYSALWSYGYYESMATTAPSAQTAESNITFSVMGEYYLDTGVNPMYPFSTYVFGCIPSCIYIQGGFTHVAANGNRWMSSIAGTDWYRTDANYYMFRKSSSVDSASLDYTGFSDAFSVAAPGVTDTVNAWAQASLDLGATYYHFLFFPMRVAPTDDNEVRIEVTDLTFTRVSDNVPVASAGSDVEYYHINAKLSNTTTSDYIDIDYYSDLGSALVISTSAHTVVDNDSGVYARGAIQLSNYRHDWLKMTPGSNVLQWDETGATGLTIVVKRRERKL